LMIASPIKWVGGKSKLRSAIIPLLPRDAECYVEVFAGAAWVLFGKEKHPVEVLNDKDGELVNLWRVLKWRKAELLEEVHKHLYSREMFMELRENKPAPQDELARATWLYLMIQMAFGADVSNSQNAGFGYWNKSRGDLFLYKSLEQFEPAKERLRGVFIENLDFEDVIRRYDQPRSLFFCDPPYLETSGYSEAFTIEDHQRLAGVLKSVEGRFLLTINDHSAIREMYVECNLIEAQEARAISRETDGRQAAPILIISNYNLPYSEKLPATNPQVAFEFTGAI
jgi:DNA adenine methylase